VRVEWLGLNASNLSANLPSETVETPVYKPWRDPRVVSIGVAVGTMVLDDLPLGQYATFHDPGGAAVLSTLLALPCGLLAVTTTYYAKTRRELIAIVVLLLFLNAGGKGMLYVRNAHIIDPLVLWAGSMVIAIAYVKATRRWRRLVTVLVSVPLALGVSHGLEWLATRYAPASWNSSWPFFVLLVAYRVLVPYCFWTMLIPRPEGLAQQRAAQPDMAQP
jgi:hypothetical protein